MMGVLMLCCAEEIITVWGGVTSNLIMERLLHGAHHQGDEMQQAEALIGSDIMHMIETAKVHTI